MSAVPRPIIVIPDRVGLEYPLYRVVVKITTTPPFIVIFATITFVVGFLARGPNTSGSPNHEHGIGNDILVFFHFTPPHLQKTLRVQYHLRFYETPDNISCQST